MNWIKKIWKDPVWSKVISVGVLTLLSWIGNLLTDGWILSTLKTLWGCIKSLLLFEVAVYWVFVFLILVMLVWFITVKLRKKTYPYQEYIKDRINGFNCEWNYDKNGDIVNIQIYCPTDKCNTSMRRTVDMYMDLLKCPRCNFSINNFMNSSYNISDNDLKLVIRDNIRRKYGTK